MDLVEPRFRKTPTERSRSSCRAPSRTCGRFGARIRGFLIPGYRLMEAPTTLYARSADGTFIAYQVFRTRSGPAHRVPMDQSPRAVLGRSRRRLVASIARPLRSDHRHGSTWHRALGSDDADHRSRDEGRRRSCRARRGREPPGDTVRTRRRRRRDLRHVRCHVPRASDGSDLLERRDLRWFAS